MKDKRGSCNKSHIFLSASSLKMSLTLTLKADLLWIHSHSIPFSFLAGFGEQWMIAESSALFLMSVWMRSTHTPTATNTHRHQHKHTPHPLDKLPYDEVSLLLSSFRETTSQSSGLYGPRTATTVQPSRCCLSGPAANTAWWDWCREEDWHCSACPAAQSTLTHTHTHRLLRNTQTLKTTSPYAPFVKILLSCAQLRGGAGNLRSSF